MTEERDDAEQVAREWLDRLFASEINHAEAVSDLAALIREQRAQARAEAKALYGFGGAADIRKCSKCEKPYPDFGVSSHMTCWECRIVPWVRFEALSRACSCMCHEDAETIRTQARAESFAECREMAAQWHESEAKGCARAVLPIEAQQKGYRYRDEELDVRIRALKYDEAFHLDSATAIRALVPEKEGK